VLTFKIISGKITEIAVIGDRCGSGSSPCRSSTEPITETGRVGQDRSLDQIAVERRHQLTVAGGLAKVAHV